jgi:zinc transport system substrate-binding protein
MLKYIIFASLVVYTQILPAQVSVYVSILPQKYFVERIGEDKVQVVVMVQPGNSPETYEPKPQQLLDLKRAALYIQIGMPFEEIWLPKLIKHNSQLNILDARQGINLHKMPSTYNFTENTENSHQHGEFDPHIWLSPNLVKTMAQNIAHWLAEYDPLHADFYVTNYNNFAADLTQLDAEIRAEFSDIAHRRFMVFHPSWGYFARNYALQQVPIEIAGKEPNAQDLIRLIMFARYQQIKTIFVQRQFSQKSAQVIAENIGAKLIVVDPLAEDYINNLRSISKLFAAAMR